MSKKLNTQRLNVGHALVKFQDEHGTDFVRISKLKRFMMAELDGVIGHLTGLAKDGYVVNAIEFLEHDGLVTHEIARGKSPSVRFDLTRLREALDAQ